MNSLLPIAKLSTEVLLHIFLYLAWNTSRLPDIHDDPYRCVTLTHVCHNWRELALSSPELWRSIHLRRPELTNLFLKRSGQTLLQLTAGTTPAGGSPRGWLELPQSLLIDSFKLVMEQAHRIEGLTVHLSNSVIESVFEGLSANVLPAQALRRITLLYGGDSPPPNILSPHILPALTSITLRGYDAIWHPSILKFTSLESIFIEHAMHLPSTPSGDCIVHGLLQLLSKNPRMRVLEFVDNCCPGETSASDTVHDLLPLVNLPSLERLKFRSAVCCINLFLTQCTFPSSTITNLTISGNCNSISADGLSERPPAILQFVMTRIAQNSAEMSGFELSFGSLRKILNDSIRTEEVTLEIYHSNPSSTSPMIDKSQLVRRHRLCFNLARMRFDRTLHTLLLSLPLSNVTYLKLGAFTADPANDTVAKKLGAVISDLIRKCSPSGLRVLELSGPALFLLPFLLHSMNPSIDSGVTRNEGDLESSLFRSLHTLVISRTRGSFRSGRHGIRSLGLGGVFDALGSQATWWKGTCRPFSKLILEECLLSEDLLHELVDSVADIVNQRGRFTTDPPMLPYYSPPHSHIPTILIIKSFNLLPDEDLDGPSAGHTIPLPPSRIPYSPPDIRWDAYVRWGRVAFDFRGCSGVQVDHSNSR